MVMVCPYLRFSRFFFRFSFFKLRISFLWRRKQSALMFSTCNDRPPVGLLRSQPELPMQDVPCKFPSLNSTALPSLRNTNHNTRSTQVMRRRLIQMCKALLVEQQKSAQVHGWFLYPYRLLPGKPCLIGYSGQRQRRFSESEGATHFRFLILSSGGRR